MQPPFEVTVPPYEADDGVEEYVGVPISLLHARLLRVEIPEEHEFVPAPRTLQRVLSGERRLEAWLFIRIIYALGPAPAAVEKLFALPHASRPHYLDSFFTQIDNLSRHQPEQTRVMLASISRALTKASAAAGEDTALEAALLADVTGRVSRPMRDFDSTPIRRLPRDDSS